MIKFFSKCPQDSCFGNEGRIPETPVISGIPRRSIPETTQKLDHRVTRFYDEVDMINQMNG